MHRNAAPSASPARRAGIAGSCRSGRRAPCAFQDGELALVDGSRRAKGNVYSPEERERWHAMLVWIANERDYKPGWVAHKYKEKFGTWPPWGERLSRSRRPPNVDHGCAAA